MFASISGDAGQTNIDNLDMYLESPPSSTIKDPLAYWTSLEKGTDDPGMADLARMALDFLSIPGTCLPPHAPECVRDTNLSS